MIKDLRENDLGFMVGTFYSSIFKYDIEVLFDRDISLEYIEKNIEVTFLKGNTNEGSDGVIYTTDESTDTIKTAIVHPAFNLGGTELKGFWIAKFEASGTNKDGNAVGNASSSSSEA